MKKKPLILALLAGIALSGAAQAGLMARGGGMIYDTDLNLTWLADANYAMTSGADTDGRMNWATANAWAANLVYGGYNDWRLPTALNQDGTGPCSGYYCTGSEMSHLFFIELGGTAGYSILSSVDSDLALFQNIQSSVYWSGTEYAPDPGIAWGFGMHYSAQGAYSKGDELYAWAVRPGDVAAANGSTVPEPQTLALVGLGLLGLAVMRRRG